ncbi:ovarian cancer G-protein coupled receptor 1-like [Poeciliopsis prolifica]|uniref:ovarian cancer G-protein coupled receptor 1-like n=1 Tax=Poeciliopsis prolifica TaxID=188132 RepID=UPI00241415FC|nr:ovarian cancer G-protein coupled receptor 1-like [Poeciliopsis prolifica]
MENVLQKQISHQEASSLDESDMSNESFEESNMHNYIFDFTVYAHVGQLRAASIGLPLTVIAIFAVYLLIKKDHVTPVYIINLLLSDLIQLCCMVAENLVNGNLIVHYTYFYALMVSIGFMVCVSLERYLAVAWPLWYRFRRDIKTSLVVCIVIWMLPTFFILFILLKLGFQVVGFFCAVFLILPLPLLTFFLVGTIKALSAAHSVSADEKRRILAILVVVLLTYTVLFFPSIIWFLVNETRNLNVFSNITFILQSFSPLADLTMYLFIRKSAIDKLLISICCCKMSDEQQRGNTSTDRPDVSTDQEV